jgi:hypothetical protein
MSLESFVKELLRDGERSWCTAKVVPENPDTCYYGDDDKIFAIKSIKIYLDGDCALQV